MSALGDPRDGGGPPARALLPALQTRTMPRRRPRTSIVDHDQSSSTATARSLEYPPATAEEAQLKTRASELTGAASTTTQEDTERTLRRLPRPAPTRRISPSSRRRPTTRTFTPLDLDRSPQELGHHDDYQDRHPCNGSAPCLDDALLRAPLTPSPTRERSTARLGPHHAGARTPRRLTARGRGICPGSSRPRARVP